MALMLGSNDFLEWCVRRLEKGYGNRNEHVLSVWQSASAYYTGAAISESVQPSAQQEVKNAKAAESYDTFVIPGMMLWAEEQGHTFPTWLNRDLMGRPTLDGECVFFHVERTFFALVGTAQQQQQ